MANRGASSWADYLAVAKRQFDEAEFLHEGGRFAGAAYLAGRPVECVLKALILGIASDDDDLSKSLKYIRTGKQAHDLALLRRRYLDRSGLEPPDYLKRDLGSFDRWDVNFRYAVGPPDPEVAEDFIHAADRIILWAGGVLGDGLDG